MAKYSEEFRKDAVALVRQGATQSQICKDLGISKSALSKWVTDADRADRGLPLAAEVTREEDAQIRELIWPGFSGSSDIRWGSWGESAGGEEHAEPV
ncbi:transposase, partial [Pseudoclavibacter helvolus]|uniref:transposase n=1 Tax=Pseudoclavibacter helvolus TaxID=255205 RepID=UPI0035E7E318